MSKRMRSSRALILVLPILAAACGSVAENAVVQGITATSPANDGTFGASSPPAQINVQFGNESVPYYWVTGETTDEAIRVPSVTTTCTGTAYFMSYSGYRSGLSVQFGYRR